MNIIEFPDVELMAIALLQEGLPGVTIASSVPTDRQADDELVVARRIPGGSIRSLVIEDQHIQVGAWDRDDVEAAALARRALAILRLLPGAWDEGTIYRVRSLDGPGAAPDDISWNPRSSFLIEVAARGEEIDTAAS